MTDRIDESRAVRLAAESPVPPPSEEAREAARAAFLGGRARNAAPGPVPARLLFPLAAAASVILALWFGTRSAERWTVLESVDAERDDGRALDAGDRFAFATLVTTGIGSADVQLGESLRIVAPPGAKVELPPGPGRWWGRARELRVAKGEIFATTGGLPLDFELIVVSPETRTRIVGTTFGVRRNASGTCVCLWKGRILTESPDGSHVVDVPEGMRVQFFSVELEPEIAPLTEEEEARLRALHESGIAPADEAGP